MTAMSSLESGWLINFKNGHKVILSEKAYLKYQEETPKEDVECEEHWFIIEHAFKKYPDLDLIE